MHDFASKFHFTNVVLISRTSPSYEHRKVKNGDNA